MLAILYINNKIIESRSFPTSNLTIPGYIEGLKNDMIEQHEDIISLTNDKPEFVFKEVSDKRKPD